MGPLCARVGGGGKGSTPFASKGLCPLFLAYLVPFRACLGLQSDISDPRLQYVYEGNKAQRDQSGKIHSKTGGQLMVKAKQSGMVCGRGLYGLCKGCRYAAKCELKREGKRNG
jgi:hypothetical protein